MIPTNSNAVSIPQPSRAGSILPITPVTAIADPKQPLPQFVQGQKYQGTIEAQLQNGNTRISVAGHVLQMQLPDDLKPGNKVELVFISREPQLKFLLKNDIQQNISVSDTGRLLGTIMQDIMKSMPLNQLPKTAPVLGSPLINSAEIPFLLQQAISQSGLFYESHLAQWVTGKNTLKQLQQEPQSKLPIVIMPTSNASNSDRPIVHAQSILYVQQQLLSLETGHLVWRGDIWPEQPMEWDISEHSFGEHNECSAGETKSQWQMQLRLTLPKMGEVTANIILNPHGICIKLDTAAIYTAKLLKDNQLPLSAAIGSAGLNLHTMEIHSSENK